MRIFFLLAALPLAAQTASQDRLRADITFLTAESLEGRLSLTRGNQVSIDWLAAEFRKAGLEPAIDGSYLQPVPLIQTRADRDGTVLEVELSGKKIKHQVTVSAAHEVTMRAPLVFAGFGITAPQAGYDDYAGLDVRGKMVLVFDHEPKESDPASPFAGAGLSIYGTPHMKMLTAAAHGASAVLVMPDPGRTHVSYSVLSARRPRTSTVNRSIPSQILDEPKAIPVVTLSEGAGLGILSASGHDGKKVQAELEAGVKPQRFALKAAHGYLQSRFLERTRANSYNVVGVLRGTDPQLRQEAILFSGHHDHNGLVGGEMMPGADDNASGTVAVAELARMFGAAAQRPKRTLIFIVFAAEERGLLGAFHYVTAPVVPLAKTRAVLNFDMVGRNETHTEESKGMVEIAADTSNELNLIGCGYSRDYCAAIENANRSVGLQLNSKWDRDVVFQVLRRSDHFPFLLESVPALWWFTGFHPDYHQPTDTVEKINFEKMAKIVTLAFRTAMNLGNAATAPEFTRVQR